MICKGGRIWNGYFILQERCQNREGKEKTEGWESVMLKCLKFAAEKWNPYDTFPEENGYHTPAEVLKFLRTLLKD